jgi:hypothetical protein
VWDERHLGGGDIRALQSHRIGKQDRRRRGWISKACCSVLQRRGHQRGLGRSGRSAQEERIPETLYVDDGRVIQSFLEEDWVDKMIIT